MKYVLLVFLFSLASQAEVKFNTQKISVNGKVLSVEIADSDKKRQQGLMNRTQLGKNKGMLFVFPQQQTLSFWMKNTFIPLSIGFFNKDKRLIDIQQMNPPASVMVKSPKSFQSLSPAKYALEVNKGWFKKNGIKLGVKFRFLK